MIYNAQLTTLARTLALLTKPTYTGTAGSDFLLAGLGSLAELTGDPVNVLGGAGNDYIVGGSRTGDSLAGEDGDDVIYGDTFGAFELPSTGGNDFLSGGAGNDKLYGQAGDDTLAGGEGNDVLYGGSGNDFLYDDAGTDLLDGGAGNDTYFYDSTSLAAATVNLGSNTAFGEAIGQTRLVSIENIVSGLGNDTLIGNAEANFIYGNAGADSITGGAGSDTLGYGNVSDSQVQAFDTVYGFDFAAGGDQFQFTGHAVDSTARTSLTLSSPISLANALNVTLRHSNFFGGGLEVNQAQLVSLEGGGLTGLYLVVDGNDQAGFQAAGDFVIKLVGATNVDAFGLGAFTA